MGTVDKILSTFTKTIAKLERTADQLTAKGDTQHVESVRLADAADANIAESERALRIAAKLKEVVQ